MCLKFVKIREFYEIFKIRKNSFYNITSKLHLRLHFEFFEFAQH